MSWQMMRLLVEVGLSLYFFTRCRVAFGGGWWQLPVLLWLSLTLTPMFFMRRGLLSQEAIELLMWVWPVWLCYMVLFVLSTLGLDLSRLGLGLAGRMSGHDWWGLLAAKKAVPVALVLSLLLSGYAWYEAHQPRLTRLEIESPRLPEDRDSLRIVHLTDIHLSRYVRRGELGRIIELAASARPDLLVVTGDLVDTDMSNRAGEAGLLAAIAPPDGAFAVMGNHELYAGEVNSVDFHQRAGLRLLRGEAVEAGGIVVAGIDDEIFDGRSDREAAGPLLARYKNDPRLVLFLKHRPRPAPGTEGLFDLQLSGHTHGGQFFPGHLFALLANDFLYGLYQSPERGAVFVSRGAGFWGMPMRFLAPPEVVLIEIKRPNEPRM